MGVEYSAGEDPTEPHAGPPHRQLQALLEGTGHVAGGSVTGDPQTQTAVEGVFLQCWGWV